MSKTTLSLGSTKCAIVNQACFMTLAATSASSGFLTILGSNGGLGLSLETKGFACVPRDRTPFTSDKDLGVSVISNALYIKAH